MNRTWAEVKLENISHNIAELRRKVSPSAAIMAVIKADAYGHGAIRVSQTLRDRGIDRFAVASVEEAVELRNSGLTAPILILGGTIPDKVPAVVEYGLTQTIFNEGLAEAVSSECQKTGKTATVHFKIDTGMSRLGFLPGDETIKTILRIGRLPGLIPEGIFTHFAESDGPDSTYTLWQLERFNELCDRLAAAGLRFQVRHAANSAAAIRYPETHLDMVRCGISIYGLRPSPQMDLLGTDLRPAMEFKARIALIKDLPAGTDISYGRRFRTERRSRVAVISAGYADGYARALGGKADVLIGGKRAPIVGTVCMDMFMADISDGDISTKIGDEVVLFGRQGSEEIPADELASHLGTINYEIVCGLSKRVPRFYF